MGVEVGAAKVVEWHQGKREESERRQEEDN